MKEFTNEVLQFIPNTEIRENLQADLEELHTCIQLRLNKAAIVLIGSLIEAILYYHIDNDKSIRSQISNYEKRTIGLNDLLNWARQHTIISEGLFRLSEPIRDFRNTIHPRVQQRINTKITENLVQIGYNVFLEIVQSVKKHYQSGRTNQAKTIVSQLVTQICGREASKADIKVYVPIIEKYGKSRGSLIIQRSLEASISYE